MSGMSTRPPLPWTISTSPASPPTVALGRGWLVGVALSDSTSAVAGSGAGQQSIDFVDECFKRWRTAVARTLEFDGQFGQDAAGVAAQHDDAVGQQDRFFDVVGDQADGPGGEFFAGPQGHQLVAQVFGGEDVEGGEGFVHQQQIGLEHQRPGEPDALAHPAGQFFGVGGFETVEADQIDGLHRTLTPFGWRDFACCQPEFNILLHGQPGHQGEVLEHHRGARVGGVEFGAVVARHAAGGGDQSGDDAQQRRFAASGATEQRDDLARTDVEVDVVENHQRRRRRAW